jgi:Flp pilus assembly protein TadD
VRLLQSVRWLAFALALAPMAPLAAQEEPLEPVQTPQSLAPDARMLADQAARRGDAPEALSRYLRILAVTPDDVAALIGAGRAALAVGDTNAAAGFFSRADTLDPKNGRVKAGLADTMLANGNARAALRLFNEAVSMGVPQAELAAERGLAFDLRGQPKRAQADYGLALQAGSNDEVTRRLAISYAIAGDRDAALATLDPLLRKQDVPAWRDRVFVEALTGDVAAAQHDATLVMPPTQAAALDPYLTRLAGLKAADKAAAIHLGRFPGETAPAPRPIQVAAPKLPIDRATLAPPTPAQSFAQVQAAAALTAAAPSDHSDAGEQVRYDATVQAKVDARTRAADRRRAQALAAAKAKQEEQAEVRAAAKRNPPRHWVQVAGGANKRDLGKAWAQLKAKWPSQLAGRTPWTLHYRFTNRLLIGPFPSSDAAQDWVGARKSEGMASFRVETNAGDPVERVN